MCITTRCPRVAVSVPLLVLLTAAIPGFLGAQFVNLAVSRAYSTAKYQAESVPGAQYVRLRTAAGTYLHLEGAAIDSGNVPVTYATSHWFFEALPNSEAFGLKNSYRPEKYLIRVNGDLGTGALNPSFWETQWTKQVGVVTPRSVKFLATADPQFANNFEDSGSTRVARVLSNATMASAIGRLKDRRGLIIAGDLTQNARRDEWAVYVASLRSSAADIYDGLGNHDFGGNCCIGSLNHSDYCRCPDLIAGELASRARTTRATNRVGNHYSWDWDDVHFVHLNLYPGISPGFGDLDPKNSLEFLMKDLAAHVGRSGRPVVLIHHYSLDVFSVVPKTAEPNPWWTEREVAPYWDAISDYNVVAIITGHLHETLNPMPHAFWYRAWSAPRTATRPVRAPGVQRATDRMVAKTKMELLTITRVGFLTDSLDASQRRVLAGATSVPALANAAAAITRAVAENKMILDYIPMFPGKYGNLNPAELTTLASWSPQLRTAAIRAMQPTIPVFIAGGAVAGYFTDFEITDSHLIATRYVVEKSPTLPTTEIETLRLPLRPPAPALTAPPLRVSKGPQAGQRLGLSFSDECIVGEIRVRAGWWIDGLQVVCRQVNGTLVEQPWRGATGGTLSTFTLKPGENIVALEGSFGGAGGQFVYSLQIITDKGRSPLFGNGGTNKGQQPFRLELPTASGMNFGIYGTRQGPLTSIGLLSAK